MHVLGKHSTCPSPSDKSAIYVFVAAVPFLCHKKQKEESKNKLHACNLVLPDAPIQFFISDAALKFGYLPIQSPSLMEVLFTHNFMCEATSGINPLTPMVANLYRTACIQTAAKTASA